MPTKGKKKSAAKKKKSSPKAPHGVATQSSSHKAQRKSRPATRTSTPLSDISDSRRRPAASASPGNVLPRQAIEATTAQSKRAQRPTARRSRIDDDHNRAPLRETNENVDRTARLEEENKRLREQLQESQRVANQLEVARSFRSVDRPSERKRNNPYEVAPLRQVLGLEVSASDPDLLKELKNETYNYLREVARDTIGDQVLHKQIWHGAHWEGFDAAKQLALREDFVRRIDKGGALRLTFYHSIAAPDVKRYTLDWPVNELLKTVLRDQRVQMLNARSKVLYGNALYNELLEHHSTSYSFPSAPIVRQLKAPKKQAIGRPRKNPEHQQALAISPASRANLKALEKSVRSNYRALSKTPEFSFDECGMVVMPPHKPLVKKSTEMSKKAIDVGKVTRSPTASAQQTSQAVYASNAASWPDKSSASNNEAPLPRPARHDDGVNLDNSDESEQELEYEYGDGDGDGDEDGDEDGDGDDDDEDPTQTHSSNVSETTSEDHEEEHEEEHDREQSPVKKKARRR